MALQASLQFNEGGLFGLKSMIWLIEAQEIFDEKHQAHKILGTWFLVDCMKLRPTFSKSLSKRAGHKK